MPTFVLRLQAPRPTFALDMTEEEQAVMGRHAEHWESYIEAGRMVVFGPVLDAAGSWGLGVLEADDEDEVRAHAGRDPAVTTGIADLEVDTLLAGFVRPGEAAHGLAGCRRDAPPARGPPEGSLRGPRASAMFAVVRPADDQTLANVTGQAPRRGPARATSWSSTSCTRLSLRSPPASSPTPSPGTRRRGSRPAAEGRPGSALEHAAASRGLTEGRAGLGARCRGAVGAVRIHAARRARP